MYCLYVLYVYTVYAYVLYIYMYVCTYVRMNTILHVCINCVTTYIRMYVHTYVCILCVCCSVHTQQMEELEGMLHSGDQEEVDTPEEEDEEEDRPGPSGTRDGGGME